MTAESMTRMARKISAVYAALREVETELAALRQGPATSFALQSPATHGPRPISMRNVIDAVADFYRLRREELLDHRNLRSVVMPRHVAMYLCRELTGASLPEIGIATGFHHVTVLYGVRMTRKAIAQDAMRAAQVETIRGWFVDETTPAAMPANSARKEVARIQSGAVA